jgi:hypothetical protein
MPGLVPGIHVFAATRRVADGRDEPGHDEDNYFPYVSLIFAWILAMPEIQRS